MLKDLLEKTHVSAFIIRSDGLVCCMMRTKLDNFKDHGDLGAVVVRLSLEPLQLVGGTYFLKLGFQIRAIQWH